MVVLEKVGVALVNFIFLLCVGLAAEPLTLSLLLEKGLEAGLFLCDLLGAQNLLDLWVLCLGLDLAILDKGRELVLGRLLARLAVVHGCFLGVMTTLSPR